MKKIFHCIIVAIFASIVFAPTVKAQYTDSGQGLFYNKTISKPDLKGIYTITLEAFVSGELTITSKNIPSDIVLVLDVSSSMAEPKGSTTTLGATSLSYNDVVNGDVDYFIYLQDGQGYYWEKIYGESYNGRYYLYARPKNKRYLSGTNNTQQGRPNNAPSDPSTNIITNRTGLVSGTSRITALQKAVCAFLDKIELADANILDEEGNIIKERNNRLGNQVAIVKFASSTSNTIGNNFDNYGQNYTQRVQTFTPIENNVESMQTTVNGFMPAGSTNADGGMTFANNLFSTLGSRESNRAVVMFTDGDPVDWNAIGTARTTKNTYNATVYTIGVFSNPTNNTLRFMNYVSSNYPNATGINNGGSGGDSGFFINASSDEVDLTKVFEYIACEVGGGVDGEEFSEAVETVDVVSASFTLPPGVTQDNIDEFVTIHSADYIGGEWNFSSTLDEVTGAEIHLDKSPGSTKNDRITVEGFNFVENWCGPDETAESGVHGKKLIITIPIQMDENAVGGPNKETNGPGSGIWVNNKNQVPFEYSPKVSLPVNIHINKKGLDEGESAKFTIERTYDDPDSEDAHWEPVSSVFVTRHKGQDETEPMTKVLGMPSTIEVIENGKTVQKPLVYRVVEDNWSWSYTGTAETPTRSDKLVTNPVTFSNSKSPTDVDVRIRHAESKATNTFKTGGGVTYDDSKTNTGEGRETK